MAAARTEVLSLNVGGGKAAERTHDTYPPSQFGTLFDNYVTAANGSLIAALQEVASSDGTLAAPDWLTNVVGANGMVSFVPRVSARWYPLVKKWGRRADSLREGPLAEGLATVATGGAVGLCSWSTALGSRTGDGAYTRVLDLPTLDFAAKPVSDQRGGWLTVPSPVDGTKVTFRPTYYRGTRDSDPRAAQVTMVRAPGGGFVLVNLHLSTLTSERAHAGSAAGFSQPSRRKPNPRARFLRFVQLSVIADFVNTEVYGAMKLPVVIAGDFNAAPDDPEMAWFSAEARVDPMLGIQQCWLCGTRFENTGQKVGSHVAVIGDSRLALRVDASAGPSSSELTDRQVCVNPSCRQPRFTHKGNLRLVDNVLVTLPEVSQELGLRSAVRPEVARVDLGWDLSDHGVVRATLGLESMEQRQQ